MKSNGKIYITLLMVLVITAAPLRETHAQSMRLVTVNTLTGALTGTMLGGATIALQDKSEIEYHPLRYGVGMGTIVGLGIGFYDLSRAGGAGYYVDGFVSSGNTSSTIILMDTFYGAATGAIVGSAISLMNESSLLKGLQFGSATGAWVGFAFGLVDAFLLSSTGSYDSFYDSFTLQKSEPSYGMVEIRGSNYALGFLNPIVFQTWQPSSPGEYSLTPRLGLEVTRLNITL